MLTSPSALVRVSRASVRRVPSTKATRRGRSASVGRCATNAPPSSTSSHSTACGESSAAASRADWPGPGRLRSASVMAGADSAFRMSPTRRVPVSPARNALVGRRQDHRRHPGPARSQHLLPDAPDRLDRARERQLPGHRHAAPHRLSRQRRDQRGGQPPPPTGRPSTGRPRPGARARPSSRPASPRRRGAPRASAPTSPRRWPTPSSSGRLREGAKSYAKPARRRDLRVQEPRTFRPCSRNWPCGPTYR